MVAATLLERLTRHRDELVERFLADVKRRDVAPEGLGASALRDSLPELFDQMVRELERNGRDSLAEYRMPAAAEHGAHRWRQGFDLHAVVREYGVLERAIYKDLEEHGILPELREIRALQSCLNSGIADAVIAYVEEANELRQSLGETQGELGESRRRLGMIAEHVPQLIWTADARGAVQWCNARWFDFTGFNPPQPEAEPASGASWLEAVHPAERGRVERRWNRAVESGERFEAACRLRAHDGRYRWFLGRAVPFAGDQSRPSEWFGSWTDIDGQKENEARLIAAREEGERLSRLKDEFLATVSHELRTPLQSILGWARLLRSGHVSPDQAHKALETIERNARAQAQLIEDILDVSRIISGKAVLHSRAVDVGAVLSAALDTTQPAARAKGVELSAHVPTDIGTLVGDADRLQQVVWNLLSNAVKFTPAGGRVELTAFRTAAELHVVVKDDGRGIAPSFLPFVFDRFRQAEASASRSHGGLGLGLAIVRHLVELHGGRVEAKSDGPGKGATFSVELPVIGVQPASPEVSVTKVELIEPPEGDLLRLDGVNVLLVDDQSDARELVGTVLREYGASVLEAETVAHALELLREQGPVDILVSDIAMPIEDGYDLIQRVRAAERSPGARLPAIALTAYARHEDQRLAIEAGYDAHLAKPVEPARLVAEVLGLCHRS